MAKAAVHFLYRKEKSNDNLFHMVQRPFALVYVDGGEEKNLGKPKQFKYCIYYVYNPITSKSLLFFINSRKT